MIFRADAGRPVVDRVWPPPPHDPRERMPVCDAGAWEVRTFPRTDPRFGYFVSRGLWHLQLWHPEAGISVISPSRLTCEQYEVFPVAEWKRRVGGYAALVRVLDDEHGLQPPSFGMLSALEAWLVDDVASAADPGREAAAPASVLVEVAVHAPLPKQN